MDSSSARPLENTGRKFNRPLGIALISLGLLLFAAGGGYVLYSVKAHRDLDRLIYTPPESTDSGSTEPPGEPTTLQQLRGTPTESSTLIPSAAFPDPASQRLFPGEAISFRYWAYPWAAEQLFPTDGLVAEGFLPIDLDRIAEIGTLPRATRLIIPGIELDAEISELALLNIGDARAYETPKNIVGHIPETANAGEAGTVWLFGHLESPIRGEGSVFRNLPKIPELLKWQPVYIVLETPAGDYLYEAVESDVLTASALSLHQRDQPSLTLVTCVPRLYYDHRLLVTANLVGFKPGV